MGLHELIRRLRFLSNKRRRQSELEEEMSLHREFRARRLAEGGSADAQYEAARLFGNETLLKEEGSDMWGWRWLEDFGQDFRHTGRGLAHSPGFAAIAILTLALGIGANTAIFSASNALLLRGLPVHDPKQIVRFSCDGQPDRASDTGNSKTSFSDFVFQHLRHSNAAMSDVMAYVPAGFNKISIRTGRVPEEASVDLVSGNFFSGLGVRALCGRVFSARDEAAHAGFAVVGSGYASRHFGTACAAVGQPVFIKGIPFTIIGVTPKSFNGVESTSTDVWIPFQVHPELNAWGFSGKPCSADPNWWCILMMGRLRPGVTKAEAEAILNPPFQRAAYEPLGGKPVRGERMTRLHLSEARGVIDSGDLREPLLILQIMVSLLLLIACGNVSMLLAVRNAARGREFSIRLALGGSKSRLTRQLLTESVALLIAGGLLGLMLAETFTRVLARWAELDISLAPDGAVLLFAVGVTCIAGLVFAVVPAFGAARISIMHALRTSAATAGQDASRVATGNAIAAVQIALCLTLLAGTGLLVRTLQNLENVDVGFKPAKLLVFGVSPHLHGDAQGIAFYRSLVYRLRSLPRVESVTLTGNRIGSNWSNNTTPYVDGNVPRHGSTAMGALMRWNNVGPDFFETLGIRLIAGRDFTDADSASAPAVAVVNETFAKTYFRNRTPIGHTVSYTTTKPFTIVGLAADSVYTSLTEEKVPMAWFPYTQTEVSGEMHFEMRIEGDPMTLLPKIREVVSNFAPDLALLQPRTQQAEFEETIGSQRLLARLSVSFALLAALLVAIGLYGTTSYQVARRTSELGIRMALGAERGQVMWMILRRALLLALVGVSIGMALTLMASRFLATLLFGVQPNDHLSLVTAVLGILVITIAATLAPARRAASVDPIVALRQE